MADLVRRIKAETPLAVTLSLGERDDEELALGARPGPTATCCVSKPPTARCSTDPSAAARRTCPTASPCSAVSAALGYEVGSGVMIGIPGQTYDDLADDIELVRRLDLDMIGVGPYLVASGHAAGRIGGRARRPKTAEQVPNTRSR